MSKTNGSGSATKGSKRELPPAVKPVETVSVMLTNIVSNTSQTRKTGVLSRMQQLGYFMFESSVPVPTKPKKGKKKKAEDTEEVAVKGYIWPALTGDDDDEKAKIVDLINDNEPDFVAFAIGIQTTGQLQPCGGRYVEVDGEQKVDLMYGMRRGLAVAYNHARKPSCPDEVRVEIYNTELTEGQCLLLALKENKDRREENPIDLALSYQELMEREKLSAGALARQLGVSDETIYRHLKLLDPLLDHRRDDIIKETLKIDPALKLLAKLKEDPDAKATRETNGGETRNKLPSIKVIVSCLEGKFPKKMPEEEREYFKSDDVRRFLCHYTGVEFTEYTEPEEEAIQKGEPTGKVYKVLRSRAEALWEALGYDVPESNTDEFLADVLSNIPNHLPDEDVDLDASLEALMDKLLECYQDGTVIQIVEKKAGKKAGKKEKAEAEVEA